MQQQFNYTRPSIMYVGYAATFLILAVLAIVPKDRLSIKIVLMLSAPLVLYFLMEQFIFKKYKVHLTDEAVEINGALSFFDKIKYDSITSVEKDKFTSNLIIKSGLNGYHKTIIPKFRISKEDREAIYEELNKRVLVNQ